MKTIIPSIIIGIWTGSEVSLGLKLSNYTTILTEAGNLTDENFNRAEIRNEQQYRNALDKIYSK